MRAVQSRSRVEREVPGEESCRMVLKLRWGPAYSSPPNMAEEEHLLCMGTPQHNCRCLRPPKGQPQQYVHPVWLRQQQKSSSSPSIRKKRNLCGGKAKVSGGDQLICPSIPERLPVASAQILILGLRARSGTTKAKIINWFRTLLQSKSLHMNISMKHIR